MKKNIEEIISVSKEIFEKGLVSGKAGNISVRFSDNVVGITPTLKSLGSLNEKDIVLIDLKGGLNFVIGL